MAAATTEAPIARAVRVEFDGPRSGFVELRASARVIADAARNMLADDQPAPDLELDALAEIANVVCGNLVGELGSPHDVYRLAPPVAVPLEPLPAAHAAVVIRLERGRVQARLAFGPAA